jgi:hypothetical protein
MESKRPTEKIDILHYAQLCRRQGFDVPEYDGKNIDLVKESIQIVALQHYYNQLSRDRIIKATLLDVKFLAMFNLKTNIRQAVASFDIDQKIMPPNLGMNVETPRHLTDESLFQDVLELVTLFIQTKYQVKNTLKSEQISKVIDSYTDPAVMESIIVILNDLFARAIISNDGQEMINTWITKLTSLFKNKATTVASEHEYIL